jgi:hypothetical protein
METSREYKTYTCSCGYKADVFGDKQKDFNGTFETHVCLNCRTLIDCGTEELEIKGLSLKIYKYSPVVPKCLSCDKSDLILWDSESCKCPKCECKMSLTRLELNIDQIGTIKIL